MKVKGRTRCLYNHGKTNEENLQKSLLSKTDLMGGVRKEGGTTSLEDIDTVYREFREI